jgi:uncharacterized phage protein gp47/JayE
MAALSTQTFTDLVRSQVAAIQGAAAGIVDFTVGSILRAVVEANAQVVLWLQGIALSILAATRASTSTGSDLDSWMADYGLTREAAAAASGQVTFSRFTPTLSAFLPLGATVESQDGSQQYAVTADPTNAAYSASLSGYTLASGVASLTVPVQASVAGAAGNAAAGAIDTITQALPGIDTVANALAFVNGEDAESDAAFRARFVAYIASLSKATAGAVAFALQSLGLNVSFTLVENFSYAGAAEPGYFYVVVDDGTGAPSSAFLAAAYAAIDAVRPLTVSFGVFPPTLITAAVSLTVKVAAGYAATTVASAVRAAISTYVDALPLGAGLNYSRIAQLAYDASPGVQNVSAVLVNGATADLTATSQQEIKAGAITVATA